LVLCPFPITLNWFVALQWFHLSIDHWYYSFFYSFRSAVDFTFATHSKTPLYTCMLS
jgi:hypothetical protein